MFQMYVDFEKRLSPAQRALVRTIGTLALGALTTAILSVLTLMTSYPQLTIPVLVTGLFKTFIDAFGQGLVKYFTANGDTEAAVITAEVQKVADAKIPADLDPSLAIGKIPPVK